MSQALSIKETNRDQAVDNGRLWQSGFQAP
jgi:hypothetical protein